MAVVLVVPGFLAGSGRFLIVNQPVRSDVILVLAGDTERRPQRGLELLRDNYAPRLILDVPAAARVFEWSELDLAQKYIGGLAEAQAITICPIHGLSTRTEAQDASQCLERAGARRVLLVTSEFHSRRALSIFQKKAPNHTYSVAAAADPNEFGAQWWRHRQWAKVNVDEWTRLIWWELIERWG